MYTTPSAPGYATCVCPIRLSIHLFMFLKPFPFPFPFHPSSLFPFLSLLPLSPFFPHFLIPTHHQLLHSLTHSLSLALPVGPSCSSSPTTSSPAIIANSAFCNVAINSVFRGSTSSAGFSFALLRILFVFGGGLDQPIERPERESI